MPNEPSVDPETPEPSLNYLQMLMDDAGLLQHAKFVLPDQKHGYCTDDNARAVIVLVHYYRHDSSPGILKLLRACLSFICHAQRENGTFRNFMGYDRRWVDPEPAHDGLGRALWAFGSVIAAPPMPELVPVTKILFDKSVPDISTQSPRGRAYAIFGLRDYLSRFPDAGQVRQQLKAAAEFLAGLYENTARKGWQWFENILCYDNAVLPCALFDAYVETGNETYLEIATKTCDFLLDNTFTGDHFSFIGSNGWYVPDGPKARFDQQPLEAAGAVMMCRKAYEATGSPDYLKLQQKAFDWFLGDNDLGLPLYDRRTKGCSDGLQENRVNSNQGAESQLSFLSALLTILDRDRPAEHTNHPVTKAKMKD